MLASDRREIFVATVPEGAERYKADLTIDGESKSLPFSRTRQWSIVIVDEGPPEPQIGHFKYAVDLKFSAFWHWALDQRLGSDQLTPSKLVPMMRRYQDIQPLDLPVTPAEGDLHRPVAGLSAGHSTDSATLMALGRSSSLWQCTMMSILYALGVEWNLVPEGTTSIRHTD